MTQERFHGLLRRYFKGIFSIFRGVKPSRYVIASLFLAKQSPSCMIGDCFVAKTAPRNDTGKAPRIIEKILSKPRGNRLPRYFDKVHYFEIISDIEEIETIAVGRSIRNLAQLQEQYGGKRWRKQKGVATVQLVDGSFRTAEVHWYECSEVGRKRFKIKRFVD